MEESSSAIPPWWWTAIVDDFPLDDSFFIPWCGREGEWSALAVCHFALRFDFADAFAAVPFDVFGEFNEAEDIFLEGGVSMVCGRGLLVTKMDRKACTL